jgi:hypothetical protein
MGCDFFVCVPTHQFFPASATALGYKQKKIVGMGMNENELKKNPVLLSY